MMPIKGQVFGVRETGSAAMTLWVVGKVTNYDAGAWEFIGVFDNRLLAELACRDDWYFVGVAELNEALPHETVPWREAYYPKRAQP
jgi:hypothetical protein